MIQNNDKLIKSKKRLKILKYKIVLQSELEAETPKDLMDAILDDPTTFLDGVVIVDENGNKMTFSDIIKE